MRSVHFVPAGNDRFWAKAIVGNADTLIIDLEDSVPADRKVAARDAAREWLAARCADGRRELMVRINAVGTPWSDEDVVAVTAAGADSIMVPKVSVPAELALWRARTRSLGATGG